MSYPCSSVTSVSGPFDSAVDSIPQDRSGYRVIGTWGQPRANLVPRNATVQLPSQAPPILRNRRTHPFAGLGFLARPPRGLRLLQDVAEEDEEPEGETEVETDEGSEEQG